MKGSTAFFTLSLLPFILLFCFIWPSGDDLSYAAQAESIGYLDAFINEYRTWNGRYISNLFVLANPIRWGFVLSYRATCFVLSLAILYVLYRTLYNIDSLKHRAFEASSLILLTYLLIIPDLSEGIYWYTSATTYYLAIGAFLPLLVLYPRLKDEKDEKRTVFAILLIQFAASGMNEIAMVFLLLYSFYFLYSHRNRAALTLLIFQLSFSALVIFSPGNEIRSAFFTQKHDIINTLHHGFLNTLRFGVWFLISPITWLAPLYLRAVGLRTPLSKKTSIELFLLSVLGLFLSCALPIWSTGIIGQHRTVNFALFFVLIFWGNLWLNNNKLTFWVDQLIPRVTSKKILALLAISMPIQTNFITAISDLTSGKALKFSQEQELRHQELRITQKESQSNEHLELPFLNTQPKSIFVYDLDTNITHWKNTVYLQYYRLNDRGIKIKPVRQPLDQSN